METSEPRAECDELLAVVQRAVGDDAAQRCTAALRAQGVSAVVDWFVLETADEDLCRELLADVAAAEKLSRVQVAKLRLALRGQSARFYPARLSDEEGERRPLWSSFRRYTLPNPLEVAFVFTNRPGWYRAVFDALDGHRLREAYMEQSQIFMLVSALLLGGLLTLIAFDLGRDQARGPPLHIICLSLNLNAFFTAFCAVLFQLYALHVYLPVHVDNLRDALRSTQMLPVTPCVESKVYGAFHRRVDLRPDAPVDCHTDDRRPLLRDERLGDVPRAVVRGDAADAGPGRLAVPRKGPGLGLAHGAGHLARIRLRVRDDSLLHPNLGGGANHRPLRGARGAAGAAAGGDFLVVDGRQSLARRHRPLAAQSRPQGTIHAPPASIVCHRRVHGQHGCARSSTHAQGQTAPLGKQS